MSQRNSEYPRQPDDDYATPAWVAWTLTPYLMLRKHSVSHVWDPAAGAGHLVEALQVADRHGQMEATFFRITGTTDDFLTRDLPPDHVDALVTNPPYKLARQFIEHALELGPPKVRIIAMLLRSDFDSAKTRAHLFRDCPTFAHKIVLLDRIVWFEREGAAGGLFGTSVTAGRRQSATRGDRHDRS
jgi:hypothetical protein